MSTVQDSTTFCASERMEWDIQLYKSHPAPTPEQAMVELTESWQELFDKSIRVKRIARRALEATGRDEGVYPRRGYEEQPPAGTLIPPTIPTREEPRGTPEKKGAKGPSLPKRKAGSPGASPNEKSQAEARQLAVEAVCRITSSCSSLESSAKCDKGGMAGGEWDPMYDRFALDERGPQTVTSPSEGRKTRGPQKNRDTEGRGETPKGRPLPTLREVYQMNLKRALEEMAEVPCDICGSQDHDYHHCQAGALLESQMPGNPQPGQNDDRGNLSQGPCGWCEKKGHISLECPAKFYSQSMKERFPKMKKKRKSKILEYTCRRCGEQHPFNRYCPYAIEPPIVPGECRSCATLTNHHDEECELVAIKDRISLCAFCGDISHLYADCPDQYPNSRPKRILPRKEGPDRTISPSIGRDPPAPPPYSGVCSFCGSAGHGHELCPKLKEAVREQAEQIARIQMARYEEARNRAQEPSSQTKKMINYVQDKAKIAKEDHQDRMRLPEYSAGGDGGSSGPDGDDEGDPTDQDRDSSSEWGGNGFPFRRRGGRGGPPEDPDLEDDDGTPRGFGGRRGPRGHPGPWGPEGPRGPPGLMGPRGISRALSSTGLGDMVLQSPNVSTIAVENSLQYVGESLSRLMLTQQNVNRNMVDHLNLTAEAQDVQTHV